MATARKLRRAQQDSAGGKAKRKALNEPIQVQRSDVPDALSAKGFRSMALRAAIPVGGAWLLGVLIYAVSQSATVKGLALGIPAVVTVGVIGVFIWAARQAKKARAVAGILADADDQDGRRGALEKLNKEYKGKDPAAVFAKAQLLMQEDPRQALEELQRIDLGKAQPQVADQARAQRALVHLMLGEATTARDLADGIDVTRHKDIQSKAFMSTVVAEAWARTGQSKRGAELIESLDPDDPDLAQLRPQLLRSKVFVAAYRNDVKSMRALLKKMIQIDARLLGGFMVKKTHPLLQKEARKMLEQSGSMPRKMQIQRRV